MGATGSMDSRTRQAAKPTARTDKPRFRARRPKNRSIAGNHCEPPRGQQNASPTVIRQAAVSMIRSDGPLCAEGGGMLDSGATEPLTVGTEAGPSGLVGPLVRPHALP